MSATIVVLTKYDNSKLVILDNDFILTNFEEVNINILDNFNICVQNYLKHYYVTRWNNIVNKISGLSDDDKRELLDDEWSYIENTIDTIPQDCIDTYKSAKIAKINTKRDDDIAIEKAGDDDDEAIDDINDNADDAIDEFGIRLEEYEDVYVDCSNRYLDYLDEEHNISDYKFVPPKKFKG